MSCWNSFHNKLKNPAVVLDASRDAVGFCGYRKWFRGYGGMWGNGHHTWVVDSGSSEETGGEEGLKAVHVLRIRG